MAKKESESSGTKALDLAVSGINKQFGEGTLMRLGDANKMQIDVIPTGNTAVDLALGVGGLPRGRICEIYGPCLLYTSPSPRDKRQSRMPSSA